MTRAGLLSEEQVVGHLLHPQDLLNLVGVALLSSHFCMLQVRHYHLLVLPALLSEEHRDLLAALNRDHTVRLHHLELLLPELLDHRRLHLLLSRSSWVHKNGTQVSWHLPLTLLAMRDVVLALARVVLLESESWLRHNGRGRVLLTHVLVRLVAAALLVLLVLVVVALVALIPEVHRAWLHLVSVVRVASRVVVVRPVLEFSHPMGKRTLARVWTISRCEVFAELCLVVASVLAWVELLSHLASLVVGILVATHGVAAVVLLLIVELRHVSHVLMVLTVHAATHRIVVRVVVVLATLLALVTTSPAVITATATTHHGATASLLRVGVHLLKVRLIHAVVGLWHFLVLGLASAEHGHGRLGLRLLRVGGLALVLLRVVVAHLIVIASVASTSALELLSLVLRLRVARHGVTQLSVTVGKVALVAHHASAVVFEVSALRCFVFVRVDVRRETLPLVLWVQGVTRRLRLLVRGRLTSGMVLGAWLRLLLIESGRGVGLLLGRGGALGLARLRLGRGI